MTYLEEAISCSIFTDQMFYEGILEQLDIERDFMLSCLENNIILEADGGEKKTNWIRAIIDFIKNLFKKFSEKVAELFDNDGPWIRNNLPKVKTLNYKGLKVNTLEYWKIDTSNIINTLNEFQREITTIKPGDSRIQKLQSREDVEKSGPFKKYVRRNSTFSDGIKAYFKTSDTNEPKTVTLEGDNLKKYCTGEMSKYVVEYNSTLLPSLKNTYNNFEKMLSNVERELNKTQSVGESFCVLENAYYKDTELSLCSNADIIFEATNNDDVPLNKVQSTDNNDNDNNNSDNKNNNNTPKNENVEYYNYLKHVIQLNQLALAAAMTACEERYRAYMSILKGVVSARG